jgi:hypothetical protein
MNSSIDLSSIINAQIEERVKIGKAVEAAKKAKAQDDERFMLEDKAAADLVSKIQKDHAEKTKQRKDIRKEVYERTLCELGLSAQVYPLETALLAADTKVLQPALGTVGKAVGTVTVIGKGICSRFMNGFKAATTK